MFENEHQQPYIDNRIIIPPNNLIKKTDKNDKGFQLFSTSNVPKVVPTQTGSSNLNKKRKRLIKNNKLVFLRSHSNAQNQKQNETGINVVRKQC